MTPWGVALFPQECDDQWVVLTKGWQYSHPVIFEIMKTVLNGHEFCLINPQKIEESSKVERIYIVDFSKEIHWLVITGNNISTRRTMLFGLWEPQIKVNWLDNVSSAFHLQNPDNHILPIIFICCIKYWGVNRKS